MQLCSVGCHLDAKKNKKGINNRCQVNELVLLNFKIKYMGHYIELYLCVHNVPNSASIN